MKKQTLNIAVETKKGEIQRIGRSAIFQRKTNFNGGTIKWHEDKLKQKSG